MQNCQLKPVRPFSTILKNDLWNNNDQVKISDMWSFDLKSNGWDWINADFNKMQPSFDDFFSGKWIVSIFSEFHDLCETPSWKSTDNIMNMRIETNDLDHISEMSIPVWTLNIFVVNDEPFFLKFTLQLLNLNVPFPLCIAQNTIRDHIDLRFAFKQSQCMHTK